MRLLVSRHLEHFLALYDVRNMRVAAERKGITQPALTKSLKTLEDEVGGDLFKRTAKGLEPTEAGETLYRYAHAIDQEARFATLDIQRSAIETKGLLRMGVGPALAVSFLPTVLVDFHHNFPSVQVSVETGITSRLIEQVISGDIDVMISARPQRALPDHFAAMHLFSNNMVAVCRRDHPLHGLGRASIEQLCQYRRIGFLDDHDFDIHARKIYGKRVEKMTAAMRTNSVSVMLQVLAATDHFAIINEVMLPAAMQQGLVPIALHDALWVIHIELICKLAFIDSRPIKALLRAWSRQHVSIEALSTKLTGN
ncbi:MAG TPA: LysR family transcriptional regulator [Devosia sp.]|nr:LysR family transcriptional regulator [Devosia sp.]